MSSQVPAGPRRRPLARAAYPPTAVALTGAGVAIGAADHSVVLAVVLGALGGAFRMSLAAPRAGPRAPPPPARPCPGGGARAVAAVCPPGVGRRDPLRPGGPRRARRPPAGAL